MCTANMMHGYIDGGRTNLFEGEVQGMEDCAWLQWTVVPEKNETATTCESSDLGPAGLDEKLVVTHLFDVVVMESSLFRGFRAV